MIECDGPAEFEDICEQIEEPRLTTWREQLREQCAVAIASLPEELMDELPSEDDDEPPSLYSYFEEVVTLRNEVRRGNRKTAETFAKFGEVLEGMREDSGRLRERLGAKANSGETARAPRKQALELVDVCDRVRRLEEVSQSCQQQSWLARLRGGDQWQMQTGALSILRDHLEHLLHEVGVTHIDSAPGRLFDPHQMKAVSRHGPAAGDGESLVVAEEFLPGYRLGDYCLRPAEVRLISKSITS